MNQHSLVLKALHQLARENGFRLEPLQDGIFFKVLWNTEFYKKVFNEGAEDLSDSNCLFRQIWAILKEYNYTTVPGSNGVLFGCLDDIDLRRKQKRAQDTMSKISYNENDVLS